mgnify:CR=1 FL=1
MEKEKVISEKEAENLRRGYWQVLFNGADKLGIKSEKELSDILRIKHTTINNWRHRENKDLPFSDLTMGDGVFIKQFMDLYVSLRSFYVNPEDANKWLRIPNPNFKNLTPIQYMSTVELGIVRVNDYLNSKMGV